MRYARTFFILILLFCIFETVRLWYISPPEMASHFNAQGDPDCSFVPKLQFFIFQVKTALIVVGLGIVTQILLVVVPIQMINIPNREYWLSSEQRDATIDKLSSFVAVLFAAILLMTQATFELAVSANLHTPIHFAAQLMVPVIVGFIIFTFLMLFWLVRSFRLPAGE